MVLVLFEPAKSADPPINVLVFLKIALKTNSDDFLVAKILLSLVALIFSSLIDLEKLFFDIFFIIFFFQKFN